MSTKCRICEQFEIECDLGCTEEDHVLICDSCRREVEELSDRGNCELCEEDLIESDSVKEHWE